MVCERGEGLVAQDVWVLERVTYPWLFSGEFVPGRCFSLFFTAVGKNKRLMIFTI